MSYRRHDGNDKTFPVRLLKHFQTTAKDHEQEQWDEGSTESLTGKNEDPGAKTGIV
ncbi:hypothetical protein [Rahnella aquatilis]|uniref:hypothetical protein n=1 Tax=Rahnella aquatilis TaxID=34038 RepID=UPI0012E03072|nr:hypothetical protein [Rahnella aquatilis]